MINSKFHNQICRLTLNDPLYRQIVFEHIAFMLSQDLGQQGDISTQSVIPKYAEGKAVIRCNSGGILAGREELESFLSDGLDVKFFKKDGEAIFNGDIVLEVFGKLHNILKYERIILNFLGRMSGVATFTHGIVGKAPGVLICPTRKTLWGFLDKKAVSVGGGGTHRLGLFDAVLLKDNHLAYFDNDMNAMLSTLVKYEGEKGQFAEVEVDNISDAEKLLNTKVKAVLLDNMSVNDVRQVVKLRNANAPEVLLEASGGITERNIKKYAKTGVDIISMGELTMGSHYLDFGLDIKREL